MEKRKGEGLAQVLSVVLPPRCHHPRLDCLFQRHLRLIDRHMGAGSSFLVFWEAFLSVWCSVFWLVCLWNVKNDGKSRVRAGTVVGLSAQSA